MRIGIDAMGSDRAPGVEVKGALAARSLIQDGDRIVLVGDEQAIAEHLVECDDWSQFIDVRHASQTIGMDESPVEALRSKPDSSIAVLAQMHADGEIDACISAGNTGAFVAAAQMRLRRLRGVHRPGIAILTPTFHGPVAVLDVGANVNCRPQHLQQYGVMASVYLSALRGVDNPRVGLLSIGQEDAKGTSLVKEARELMRADRTQNFVGNVEGRDLFGGACDVLVCDGFVGNVVLKVVEGMSEGVLRGLVGELIEAMPRQAAEIQAAGADVMKKYDYNEYGGAPLLGVGGICLICHGASDYRSIMHAVTGARALANYCVNERISDLLAEGKRTVHA